MIKTRELVEKIKKEATRVSLKCEALGIDTERFVVEGDLGLSAQALPSYAKERIDIAERAKKDPNAEKGRLLGMERNGKTMRWRPGKKLTYCVWRPSFSTDGEHAQVVEGMRTATSEWESICGVDFDYQASKDTDENLKIGDVDFPVLRQDGGGSTIAIAFFPDDPVNERIIWVFDGYFGPSASFDPVGVMRHELGHSLGFRHEHIRPEAPQIFGPESIKHTVELTTYDSKSVMHYVAAGVGDPQLRFTDVDREGARIVYGGPKSEFEFVD